MEPCAPSKAEAGTAFVPEPSALPTSTTTGAPPRAAARCRLSDGASLPAWCIVFTPAGRPPGVRNGDGKPRRRTSGQRPSNRARPTTTAGRQAASKMYSQPLRRTSEIAWEWGFKHVLQAGEPQAERTSEEESPLSPTPS